MKLNLALVVILASLVGCGTSPGDEFIGDRLPDQCDGNWPVCDTFAGCRLDDGSYVQGTLPGTRKFIVHTLGQAQIEIDMLVTQAQSEGTDTKLIVDEPACTSFAPADPDSASLDANGQTFFAESQNEAGTPYSRTADVSQGGDHLITLISDATAAYLLKVTVTEQDAPE